MALHLNTCACSHVKAGHLLQGQVAIDGAKIHFGGDVVQCRRQQRGCLVLGHKLPGLCRLVLAALGDGVISKGMTARWAVGAADACPGRLSCPSPSVGPFAAGCRRQL